MTGERKALVIAALLGVAGVVVLIGVATLGASRFNPVSSASASRLFQTISAIVAFGLLAAVGVSAQRTRAELVTFDDRGFTVRRGISETFVGWDHVISAMHTPDAIQIEVKLPEQFFGHTFYITTQQSTPFSGWLQKLESLREVKPYFPS